MHLLAYHDRHPSATGRDHTVFPSFNGILLTMVRILDICYSLDNTLAILCLPAGYPLPWADEAYQAGLG